jgi:hypothetical protein
MDPCVGGFLRVMKAPGAPIEQDFAAILGEEARRDVDQRALARAVFAHEPMHLTGAHFERARTQRGHAAKALLDFCE